MPHEVAAPPAEKDLPLAVEAMREVGIDISAQRPKTIDLAEARRAKRLVSMGRGVGEVRMVGGR